MKTNMVVKKSILALSIALLFATSGCQPRTQVEASEQEATLVQVATVETKTIDNNLEFTGTVQPFEEAHLAAAQPARIERIHVDVGDFVSKGQILVEMDQTQLIQVQLQYQSLKNDMLRLDTLRRMGAVTQQSYDQLKVQYDITRTNLENLRRLTQIRATIPGVVTGRYNSPGELFSMTPGPAGKPAIVSIMQLRPVKITINISERFFPVVRRGLSANISTDLFPDRIFQGRVHKIYPTIDRATATFRVELVVDNADLSLRPGMFVRVALNLGQIDAIMVPALAVLKQVGTNERYVFVVENEMSIRKPVTVGRNFDDLQEILSGINPGETLVVTGQHNLVDQRKVQIQN